MINYIPDTEWSWLYFAGLASIVSVIVVSVVFLLMFFIKHKIPASHSETSGPTLKSRKKLSYDLDSYTIQWNDNEYLCIFNKNSLIVVDKRNIEP